MFADLVFLQLKPRCVPEYQAAWAQAVAQARVPDTWRGSWRTEVGAIDSVVQLWTTRSSPFDARDGLALRDDLVMEHEVVSLALAPFSPALEARTLGGIYELRIYDYEAGYIPRVSDKWQEKVEARMKLSPLVLCGHSISGRLHRWVHLWAYENALERQRIRAESLRQKVWPPDAVTGLIRQTNMLLVPDALSPLR